MPRQARLDAPGPRHHVIHRGMERGQIVADREDRQACVARWGAGATATGTPLYAWALVPNPAHLLLRSGAQGLPQVMRRRRTGAARTDHRRHRRGGHLFPNRDTSIVVEDDADCRDLVRSLHLNPRRAGLVPDRAPLDRSPGCGHAGIRGRQGLPGRDRAAGLAWVGRPARGAPPRPAPRVGGGCSAPWVAGPGGPGRSGGPPPGESPAPTRRRAGRPGRPARAAGRPGPRRWGAPARGLHLGDCHSGRASRTTTRPLTADCSPTPSPESPAA